MNPESVPKNLNVSPEVRKILEKMKQRPQGLHLASLTEPKKLTKDRQQEKRKKEKQLEKLRVESAQRLLKKKEKYRLTAIQALKEGASFEEVAKALNKIQTRKEKEITRCALLSLADRLCKKQGIKKNDSNTLRYALLTWLKELK